MDKTQNPNQQKTGDAMSHSFGEGYATRSDEEGFGGVFSGNQSLPKTQQQDQLIHENHPAYDKTQGSEVKEKEKGRHQTQANASTN
ncbi:unnamed protein product [Prunus armeniaca]|uniref:Uncharacterized protein n=1 Tax=Prunus armeniaca TaxID=36596 RepID=A0A6J5VJ01_PRUAR|nr:unnamed protein product [Prunus armeniaca]CAB4318024.1 unnamed protein product [Prunus armeniaca]